ncbi:hypothetical protein BJ991_001642 [Microbacterium immunditiarum]|uniref:Uncharacterized protein n=1 Tax=Microbacterium immunditiarum TaxID=337480 RepID=A0A7Y9KLD3_9MICO|nr:hypothetical protein [Microbacterium immunditiarum]
MSESLAMIGNQPDDFVGIRLGRSQRHLLEYVIHIRAWLWGWGWILVRHWLLRYL